MSCGLFFYHYTTKNHNIIFVLKIRIHGVSGNGSLDKYEENYNTLPDNVLDAIRPIYEDLSNELLLKRCLGEYNQNANESFNNLIWRIAPKNTNSNARIVEIATFLIVCLFNKLILALSKVMGMMGITIGRNVV